MPPHPGTRDRILETARRLFHERGYTAVGVADLCREAGVVKGSFYHFYPAKADLLAAVLKRNWKVLQSALETLEHAPGSGREAIARLFGMVVDHARHMAGECGTILGCNIGSVASELGPADQAVRAGLQDIFGQWLDALERMVQRGREDGSIATETDPRALARSLLAQIQGMSVLGRTYGDADMLQAIADCAVAQIPRPPES